MERMESGMKKAERKKSSGVLLAWLLVLCLLPTQAAYGMELYVAAATKAMKEKLASITIGKSTLFASLPGAPFEVEGMPQAEGTLPEGYAHLLEQGKWQGYACRAFVTTGDVFALIASKGEQQALLMGHGSGAEAALSLGLTKALRQKTQVPGLFIREEGAHTLVQWQHSAPDGADEGSQTVVALTADQGKSFRLGSVTNEGDAAHPGAKHQFEPLASGGWRMITYQDGVPQSSSYLSGKKLSDDLSALDLSSFPADLKQAQKHFTHWYTVLPKDSRVEKARLAKGKTFPVYTGPGEDYWRANNGKASVSTNGPVQVGGWENGWLMVYYLTNSGQGRIGYIAAEALSKGQVVKELGTTARLCSVRREVSMVDDLVMREKGLMRLNVNTELLLLYLEKDPDHVALGLVEARTVDGEKMRGYVPADALVELLFDAKDFAPEGKPYHAVLWTWGAGTEVYLFPSAGRAEVDAIEVHQKGQLLGRLTWSPQTASFGPAILPTHSGELSFIPVKGGELQAAQVMSMQIPACLILERIASGTIR